MKFDLNKIGGRKFLGFLIATVALFLGRFEPEWWVAAYAIYVGGNVAQKVYLGRGPRPYDEDAGQVG